MEDKVTVYISLDRTVRFEGEVKMSREEFNEINKLLDSEENDSEGKAYELIDMYIDIDAIDYDFDDIDYVDDFELVEE